MKKIISLLLAVMMVSSFAVTSYAAAGNVRVNLDKAEYEAGDTIVATIDSLEKDISTDGFNLAYDASKVTFAGIQYRKTDGSYANLTRPGQIKVVREWEPGDEETVSFQVAEHNESGKCVAFGFAGTDTSKILAVEGIVKISFTVNADATGDIVFTMNENSAGGTGYVGVADTKTVKVKAAKDETIAQGAKGDAAGNKVTWANCSVGADLVAAGKVKAVLTNTAAEAGNQTQEVALSFGDSISGGMACEFNVIVTFQDIANAATTSLNIVKVN